MRPSQLSASDFERYPPLGKKIVIANLDVLRQAPISILPTLLKDLLSYDWKFPAEQHEIEARYQSLQHDPKLLDPFSMIAVSDSLMAIPWVQQPQIFIEALTTHLWSSRQMDAYRTISSDFVRRLGEASPAISQEMPRLIMVLIGRNAKPTSYPIFEKLIPHGTLWTNVTINGFSEAAMVELTRRYAEAPSTYAHWYLDGGVPLNDPLPDDVARLFYPSVAPMNQKILSRMEAMFHSGSGPESLRTELGQLDLTKLDANLVTKDPRLQRLVFSVLTEASGTQIFSTSFVQWSAREILRRAQPATMLIRFAPRQRQLSFNTMVSVATNSPVMDPEGALIDSDMAAYYTYLEMMALAGRDRSSFVVWFEGQGQALACGPTIPRMKRNDQAISGKELIALAKRQA